MVIVLNRVYLTFMLINLISRLNMRASNIEKLTPLFTTNFLFLVRKEGIYEEKCNFRNFNLTLMW